MKQCPKCGKTYRDENIFCEACGIRLPEPITKKKSPVPIIIGCVAAAGVLIAGTVLGVTMLGGKKTEQSEQTVQQVAETEPAQENLKEKETAKTESRKRIPAKRGSEEKQPETHEVEEEASETESEAEAPGETSEAVQEGNGIGKVIGEQQEEDPEPVYEICYVVNCKESITLRKKPSTGAGEYCQIPLGAAVNYVESASNGFLKIIYNGQTGYALASYLSFEEKNDPAEAILMEVVNCQKSITLRKIPNTQAEEFCQIPLGELVEYLGTAENGFYLVSYKGYTGYALASYLTEW